jgi:hypothetical protein
MESSKERVLHLWPKAQQIALADGDFAIHSGTDFWLCPCGSWNAALYNLEHQPMNETKVKMFLQGVKENAHEQGLRRIASDLLFEWETSDQSDSRLPAAKQPASPADPTQAPAEPLTEGRRVLLCKCGLPIWGEGGNPATRERYWSHVSDSKERHADGSTVGPADPPKYGIAAPPATPKPASPIDELLTPSQSFVNLLRVKEDLECLARDIKGDKFYVFRALNSLQPVLDSFAPKPASEEWRQWTPEEERRMLGKAAAIVELMDGSKTERNMLAAMQESLPASEPVEVELPPCDPTVADFKMGEYLAQEALEYVRMDGLAQTKYAALCAELECRERQLSAALAKLRAQEGK